MNPIIHAQAHIDGERAQNMVCLCKFVCLSYCFVCSALHIHANTDAKPYNFSTYIFLIFSEMLVPSKASIVCAHIRGLMLSSSMLTENISRNIEGMRESKREKK